MAEQRSVDDFLFALNQVVGDAYNGRPLFLWSGLAGDLRVALSRQSSVGATMAWVNLNDLASDVIPRRAREVLHSGVNAVMTRAVGEGKRVLVVENPYLLLRYEPAAPLAIFWNSFVSSRRAVVVIVPPAVPRPATLPDYVQFGADDPGLLLSDAATAMVVLGSKGGVPAR